ncbi:GGDEF domain-containing protein [Streptomyces luteireticuli]|uniref:GGDEF domain-containing protein n=1 Tax=Streptomyces luteireticuli TaxID=173858 RepID=UPI00355701D6
MASNTHAQARFAQCALFLTTVAVPLTGWTVHAVALHRRLAAAGRDPLTGALRRESWEPQVQRFINRYGDNALVLVRDIDHFKRFNDDYGHAVGDLVLATTAARIIQWAGSRGVVGRLGGDGGDEFIIAAWVGPGRRTVRLDQLNQALHEPVPTGDGHTVPVAVSVGAASADVIGTRDRSRLMRAADAAMYAGKHTGTVIQANIEHADAPSINGRRAGRLGTHTVARAA